MSAGLGPIYAGVIEPLLRATSISLSGIISTSYKEYCNGS